MNQNKARKGLYFFRGSAAGVVPSEALQLGLFQIAGAIASLPDRRPPGFEKPLAGFHLFYGL